MPKKLEIVVFLPVWDWHTK